MCQDTGFDSRQGTRLGSPQFLPYSQGPRLPGHRSQVNSEASLELPGDKTITPTSPRTKMPNCWQKGDEAWAVFQESSVILGIT